MSNEPEKIIYTMTRVSKSYQNKPVLKDISLSYFLGAKIGVLGLNASGKSSLLRIMAGVDQGYDGKALLSPGYTLGFLEQEPLLDSDKTVKAVVEEGLLEVVALVEEYNKISEKFAEPMSDDEMNQLVEHQGVLQEKIDYLDAWDIDARLEMAMDALRCPPGDTPIKLISGGEKRRVALCRLLLQKPDILLLDEPTSHLDLKHQAGIYDLLKQMQIEKGKTIVAVSHDVNLAAQYADSALLLSSDGDYHIGRIEEVFSSRQIAHAFGVRVFEAEIGTRKIFLPIGKFAKHNE